MRRSGWAGFYTAGYLCFLYSRKLSLLSVQFIPARAGQPARDYRRLYSLYSYPYSTLLLSLFRRFTGQQYEQVEDVRTFCTDVQMNRCTDAQTFFGKSIPTKIGVLLLLRQHKMIFETFKEYLSIPFIISQLTTFFGMRKV